MMPSPRFDSVPNWWEVRVHTTAAILLPKSISLPKQFSQLNYNHFELIWQTRLPFWRLFKFESTSISTWILLSKASKASVQKKVHKLLRCVWGKLTYNFYSVAVQIRLILWSKRGINIPPPHPPGIPQAFDWSMHSEGWEFDSSG